jgi:SpoVK/Ycf46/Vps4 family AAA+-type ATPase
LILSVPTGFELPQELKEYSVNLYADLPDRDTLKEIVQDSIDDVNYAFGQRTANKNKMINYCDDDVLDHLVNNLTGLSNIVAVNSLNRALLSAKNLPINKEKHLAELTESLSKIRLEKIKSSGVLDVMTPESLENIGGLENLKEYMLLRKNSFTKAARDFGVKSPKGVLLAGPPGTGKSASAKAIGSVLGLDLIRFDISRVFGSLVGQSEANDKAAMNIIKSVAPCVVLVDELDKVFNINSGGSDSGTSSRVLGDILTTMQECDKPIFWVFTE